MTPHLILILLSEYECKDSCGVYSFAINIGLPRIFFKDKIWKHMTTARVSSKIFVQTGHETTIASSVSKYFFHYIMSLSDLPKLWSMIVSPILFLSWFQNEAEWAVSAKVLTSELSSYSDCTTLLINFECLEWKFVKTETESILKLYFVSNWWLWNLTILSTLLQTHSMWIIGSSNFCHHMIN